MSSYALWVDHKHAYVYKFTNEGVDEVILKSENENSNSHHDLDKFFHTIAQSLGNAKELMIMGPGMAKEEFKNHCEKHHHKQLASAIVGVRPMAGHPTKALMVEEAREFFKHLHLWTKNY
jgi:stalled ribosome rescue protein Dom34